MGLRRVTVELDAAVEVVNAERDLSEPGKAEDGLFVFGCRGIVPPAIAPRAERPHRMCDCGSRLCLMLGETIGDHDSRDTRRLKWESWMAKSHL